MAAASRDQETGSRSREQELGFVILNEVTHSVLRKNLNLCPKRPYRRSHLSVENAACPVPAKPSFRRERGLSRSGEAVY